MIVPSPSPPTATDRPVPSAPALGESVLQVEGLRTEFATHDGIAVAVDEMSFELRKGETLAIVGESGSGKSVTALSILRLVPKPAGRIAKGVIRFAGRNLLDLSPGDLQAVRGGEIAMIFQDPMTSLNPVLTIGRQITEAIEAHRGLRGAKARQQAVDMLERGHIPEAARQMSRYPHQLSGGMRQRVMIAMALSCRPRILIADEPTTALDVTVQAQILDLMRDLQREFGTSIILITHDMGIVAEMADRVIVMYAGRKVEEGPADPLFAWPRHPYTRGLLDAMPALSDETENGRRRLVEIQGIVPPLTRLPKGCRFAPRCGLATETCLSASPIFEEKAPAQCAACWHAHLLPDRGLPP